MIETEDRVAFQRAKKEKQLNWEECKYTLMGIQTFIEWEMNQI